MDFDHEPGFETVAGVVHRVDCKSDAAELAENSYDLFEYLLRVAKATGYESEQNLLMDNRVMIIANWNSFTARA